MIESIDKDWQNTMTTMVTAVWYQSAYYTTSDSAGWTNNTF